MKNGVFFAFLLGFALAGIGGHVRSPPGPKTLVIRDTVRETVFVPRQVRVVRTDTIFLHDTIALPLPIEQKVYAGKDYRAVVEGFRPELTALDIYRQTPVVRPKRWGIGVQAGYGVSTDGLTPYIGVGVQYSIFNF